ncbi:MAG: TIGR00730 family Rossman fold protein [Blastochloris sp.]|nr:TIGR00730 family Rossman fold protein [Blastochloris sp.]
MSFSVCVYCGSRTGKEPANEAAAQKLGSALAAHSWRLIYGGGSVGLMGAVARSMKDAGGEVIGIIPQALLDREVGMVDASELLVTSTLRERKALMDSYADVFLALPGGFGTLEELLEILTLRQLRYHEKPIIIVNLGGYFTPLLQLFDHAAEHGYVAPHEMQLFEVANTIAEVLALLEKIARAAPGASHSGAFYDSAS